MKHRPYTKEEDLLIVDNISKYPNNINYACTMSGEALNRSPRAVSLRYYQKLRKTSSIITVASNTGVSTINNQKNAHVPKEITLTDADIFDIIKEHLKKLPKQYKINIVHWIFNK